IRYAKGRVAHDPERSGSITLVRTLVPAGRNDRQLAKRETASWLLSNGLLGSRASHRHCTALRDASWRSGSALAAQRCPFRGISNLARPLTRKVDCDARAWSARSRWTHARHRTRPAAVAPDGACRRSPECHPAIAPQRTIHIVFAWAAAHVGRACLRTDTGALRGHRRIAAQHLRLARLRFCGHR